MNESKRESYSVSKKSQKETISDQQKEMQKESVSKSLYDASKQ
jgi:hypothetical protein